MTKTMLALVAAAMTVCARAEASPVTFTLVNSTYNDMSLTAGAQSGAPLNSFQLTIDSAAMVRGTFTLQGFTANGSTVVGDVADFVSANTPTGASASPFANFNTFNTQLTFTNSGIASGTINFSNMTAGVQLSGSNGQFAGSYGGDNSQCGASLCQVTGQLLATGYAPANVPEPLSAVLVLSGIAGFGFCRRRS